MKHSRKVPQKAKTTAPRARPSSGKHKMPKGRTMRAKAAKGKR